MNKRQKIDAHKRNRNSWMRMFSCLFWFIELLNPVQEFNMNSSVCCKQTHQSGLSGRGDWTIICALWKSGLLVFFIRYVRTGRVQGPQLSIHPTYSDSSQDQIYPKILILKGWVAGLLCSILGLFLGHLRGWTWAWTKGSPGMTWEWPWMVVQWSCDSVSLSDFLIRGKVPLPSCKASDKPTLQSLQNWEVYSSFIYILFPAPKVLSGTRPLSCSTWSRFEQD